MTDETLGFQPIEERLRFPELDQTSFDQIVNTGRNTRLFGFPKRALDRIYEFWSGMGDFTSKVVRMDKAMRLPGVPGKERDAAKKYYTELVEVAEPISTSLRGFYVKPEGQRSWKEDGKPIYEAIKDYDDREDVGQYEESITALLEAISETEGKGWTTEPEMRQKIAQHALEELWNTCDYEKLYYAADVEDGASTIDNFNQEKAEFVDALNMPLWDEAHLKQQKKLVSAIRRAVKEIDDGTYSENIATLWDTARGKAENNTTAIDVFIATEEIFQGLKNEGAFEWDPEDEYDEEESSDE